MSLMQPKYLNTIFDVLIAKDINLQNLDVSVYEDRTRVDFV